MKPLTVRDMGTSDAGTGWVGAQIAIERGRVKIIHVALESTGHDYAESAYIRIVPMVATPAVATLNPRAIAVKHGLVMDIRDLDWSPNFETNGPVGIIGWVYHNESNLHSIRVWYEVLED